MPKIVQAFQTYDGPCCACLNDPEEDVSVCIMGCGHYCCMGCLWENMKEGRRTCPLCGTDQVPDPETAYSAENSRLREHNRLLQDSFDDLNAQLNEQPDLAEELKECVATIAKYTNIIDSKDTRLRELEDEGKRLADDAKANALKMKSYRKIIRDKKDANKSLQKTLDDARNSMKRIFEPNEVNDKRPIHECVCSDSESEDDQPLTKMHAGERRERYLRTLEKKNYDESKAYVDAENVNAFDQRLEAAQ